LSAVAQARITQEVVEALYSDHPTSARLTQEVAEVLYSEIPHPTSATLTQTVLEVAYGDVPPIETYVLIAHPDNTKVLDLGTGGVPPSNWQTIGFNDSTWATPRNDTVYGPDWITIPGLPVVPYYAVFRWNLTITAPPTGATLSIVAETHA